MSRLRQLLAALLVALALPDTLRAQIGGTTDIITGAVTTVDGRPIAGARIDATSLDTDITRSRDTGDDGRFTLLFPDGGGQYRLTVRYVGMQPWTTVLAREADEDRFIVNVTLSPATVTLSPVVIEATQSPPRAGERRTPGSTERTLGGDQLQRLPIDGSDPNSVALLAPGVVGVEGTDTTAGGFSVAGQRPDQNQVTLDGLAFDAGAVPTEAVRTTRVVTNSYDVSRGQFTGGQVASTTRGGTNVVSGSLGYALRDPALQWDEVDDDPETSAGRGASLSRAYTQHQLSGGIGGPIVRNRAFWFGAFQLRRRLDPLESLLGLSPSTLAAYGTDPDSAQRFLDVVDGFGVPLSGASLPDERTTGRASLLARLDLVASQDHNVMLRGNWERSLQQGARVGALALPTHGGEQGGFGGGAMVTVSSVLGSFLNEARAGWSYRRNDGDPYLELPEGRVQVASRLGTRGTGVSTLAFGGNPGLPSGSRERGVEISDELSWLTGAGAHRWKLGAMLDFRSFERSAGANRAGTFTFNSLDALASGEAASFTRALTSNERSGGTVTGALHLGDTWRRGRALQLTYGLRAEGSYYSGRPDYNPEIEERFGRFTDHFPTDGSISPRVGFTITLGPSLLGGTPDEGPQRRGRGAGRGARGGGGGGGFPQATGAGPFVIRGGLGEYRGRAPTSLFSSAIEATGLPSGEIQLVCTGDDVPVPDWAAYLADPSTIPTTCADGGTPGAPGGVPNVTVFDPAFQAPRSWRASLGVSRRLNARLNVGLEGSYALGRSLYGVRDLNLDTVPRFTLASEGGRPVFVDPGVIAPATGAAPLAASRVDPDYAYVLDVHSKFASRTAQATLTLNGTALRSLLWNTSWTLMRSRDQSSFSSGRGGGGSARSGFSAASTAGNPNEPEWAPSDFERRHVVTGSGTWLARPWLDLTTVVRLTSGAPYTPRVAGDVNGDGARNDRAFVFDPAAVADTAIAAGMTRLLARAPEEARACLTSQLGRVAGRNSCRAGWATSLDLQANLRPDLGPRVGRRLQVMVTFVNPLAGLDRALHGRNGLRGWGQPAGADPTLLQVRGFDQANGRYLYTVNERFGSNASARAPIRNPFGLAVQARLQVGPDRQRERLEAGLRAAGARRAQGGGAGRFDLDAMAARLAPDPVAPIIARRDSLQLTDGQVARLRAIGDSLRPRIDSVIAGLRAEVERETAAGASLADLFPRLRPRLQAARDMYLAAVGSAEQVLTPEQWRQLPEEVRNPVLRMGSGGRQRTEP